MAIKKRASHPSSIREPDIDFRKLVDKLEQAEITMKLESHPGNKILTIEIDREIILSHHTGVLQHIETHNKIIEVVHLIIKDKSITTTQKIQTKSHKL